MKKISAEAIATLEEQTRTDFDNQLKEQTETVIHMLDYYNEMYQNDECTYSEAREMAAEMAMVARKMVMTHLRVFFCCSFFAV